MAVSCNEIKLCIARNVTCPAFISLTPHQLINFSLFESNTYFPSGTIPLLQFSKVNMLFANIVNIKKQFIFGYMRKFNVWTFIYSKLSLNNQSQIYGSAVCISNLYLFLYMSRNIKRMLLLFFLMYKFLACLC